MPATAPQIVQIRQKSALTPDDVTYGTNEDLSNLFDELGTVDLVAAYIWRLKAAAAATLVNTSESGSSRSLGDIHKNALAMAKSLEGETSVVSSGPVIRSSTATRESSA